MLFIVIERFKSPEAAAEVYRRFAERGRMLPDGLKYLDSWVERMKLAWEAERDAAVATVRHFNGKLSTRGYSWFWPKITTAITAKYPWLIVVCDACGTVVDLDLSVKPRDPEASIRVALRDIRCPRCNGHGRPRISGLANRPSI
jgi:hypothetical protein